MEPGYVKADSRNLPAVNHLMIAQFFSKSDLYLSAEIRAVKNQRWVTVLSECDIIYTYTVVIHKTSVVYQCRTLIFVSM